MEETFIVQNPELLKKLKELSNKRKFRIIELTQHQDLPITLIAKQIKLAYNKCSDYCARLENQGFIEKRKEGKEVFVRSKIDLKEVSDSFN